MRLQIASDLHLEYRPTETFEKLLEPSAPILALLGDIAPLSHPNLKPFLQWCSERWETILWIPGHTELFFEAGNLDPMMSLKSSLHRMSMITRPFSNLHLLHRDAMTSSDGIFVLGLTFWKFPRDGTRLWSPASGYVEAEASPLPDEAAKQMFHEELNWVRAMLKTQKHPVVILSHIAPVTFMQEEWLGDPESSIRFPDIEVLLKEPLVAWICGHSHSTAEFSKTWNDAIGGSGTVLVATNGLGFPKQNPDYRRDYVVRVDPNLVSK